MSGWAFPDSRIDVTAVGFLKIGTVSQYKIQTGLASPQFNLTILLLLPLLLLLFLLLLHLTLGLLSQQLDILLVFY